MIFLGRPGFLFRTGVSTTARTGSGTFSFKRVETRAERWAWWLMVFRIPRLLDTATGVSTLSFALDLVARGMLGR
jgi:hypothetical protein